jgi:hypothetical protein
MYSTVLYITAHIDKAFEQSNTGQVKPKNLNYS